MTNNCCKLPKIRNRNKQKYLVWQEQYRILATFMVAIFLFSAIQITFLSVFLVEIHLSQILELGFIKSEQIFSNMLAEMKQNEMSLVSQGIWGSSKALSDMISRPEIIREDFLPTNTLISAFEYYNSLESNSPEF